jgi:hypothetical protein
MAKHAALGTADLRGKAKGQALGFGHEHGFNFTAIDQADQKFKALVVARAMLGD